MPKTLPEIGFRGRRRIPATAYVGIGDRARRSKARPGCIRARLPVDALPTGSFTVDKDGRTRSRPQTRPERKGRRRGRSHQASASGFTALCHALGERGLGLGVWVRQPADPRLALGCGPAVTPGSSTRGRHRSRAKKLYRRLNLRLSGPVRRHARLLSAVTTVIGPTGRYRTWGCARSLRRVPNDNTIGRE